MGKGDDVGLRGNGTFKSSCGGGAARVCVGRMAPTPALLIPTHWPMLATVSAFGRVSVHAPSWLISLSVVLVRACLCAVLPPHPHPTPHPPHPHPHPAPPPPRSLSVQVPVLPGRVHRAVQNVHPRLQGGGLQWRCQQAARQPRGGSACGGRQPSGHPEAAHRDDQLVPHLPDVQVRAPPCPPPPLLPPPPPPPRQPHTTLCAGRVWAWGGAGSNGDDGVPCPCSPFASPVDAPPPPPHTRRSTHFHSLMLVICHVVVGVQVRVPWPVRAPQAAPVSSDLRQAAAGGGQDSQRGVGVLPEGWVQNIPLSLAPAPPPLFLPQLSTPSSAMVLSPVAPRSRSHHSSLQPPAPPPPTTTHPPESVVSALVFVALGLQGASC